jgi:hypothetical protein
VNRELALKVSNAVLYEGYMLYPYRPSALKNRLRWTFGSLYPPDYSEVRHETERCTLHSEFLISASNTIVLRIHLRFLHLVGCRLLSTTAQMRAPREKVATERHDEVVEQSFEFEVIAPSPVQCFQFSVPAHDKSLLITGNVCVQSCKVIGGALKVTVDVVNTTKLPSNSVDRESALLRSLLSTHLILETNGGAFVSLLDPPTELREAANACRNVGNFPVLIGVEGVHDTMLCSPITLYDYPQIAPESAGDFYDATEMDEMLTLRVLTLAEEEKCQMRMGDSAVRTLLERTEQTAFEQLTKTHGTIRSLGPLLKPPPSMGSMDQESRAPQGVTIFGTTVNAGDRVRLWPQKSADAMDLMLKGKIAIIEAIERDFDDQVHIAVVIEDDPGRDLGMLRHPGHRFFFSPEEIEPLLPSKEIEHG